MSYPRLEAISSVILEFERFLRAISESSRKRYCERAEKVLQPYTLSEVEVAAEKLLHHQPWPKMSYLPWAIAEKAKELRLTVESADTPSADNCKLCDGDGWVTILHTAHAIEELRHGRTPNTPYTCVVCCTCKLGKWRVRQILARNDGTKPIIYDPRRHVRRTFEKTLRAQWDEVVEKLRKRMDGSEWIEIKL